MIKEKTLYFGSGDIAVSSYSPTQLIIFTNIKPPCECGQTITDKMVEDIEFGEEIVLELNDYDLYNLFCSVNKNNRILKYGEYTFDFTNYNKESVRVCKDHSKNALYMYQFALAC